MRIYQIPFEIQDFPSDDIGDNGDVAVNTFTSEVRTKVAGSWQTQFQNLSGDGTPVGSVIPSATGQYYHDTTDDTYFISTGTTSADWEEIGGSEMKVYRAIISQSGTGTPTATILENTLGGTPVWSRTGVGTYHLTLAGAFTENKTIVSASADAYDSSASLFGSGWESEDALFFFASNFSGAGTDLDGGFNSVEILVYP